MSTAKFEESRHFCKMVISPTISHMTFSGCLCAFSLFAKLFCVFALLNQIKIHFILSLNRPLKKEANWLSIWRKRQIGCQFEERVNQPPKIIHPTSLFTPNSPFSSYGSKCLGKIMAYLMSFFLHLCDWSVPYCASLEAWYCIVAGQHLNASHPRSSVWPNPNITIF